MQTFLPFDDFRASAQVLDRQRLGKQRVEGLQILQQITGRQVQAGIKKLPKGKTWGDFIHSNKSRSWGNHPMMRMWWGHDMALAIYTLGMCLEWQQRGYKDTCADKIIALYPEILDPKPWKMPRWFGWIDFHVSHQSNLLRKADQYRLHHENLPHEPHGSVCDGFMRHKPHRGCDPHLMLDHYQQYFPNVPIDLPYIWPGHDYNV